MNREVFDPNRMVIAELSYTPLDRDEASLLFHVIVKQYARADKSVARNLSFEQCAAVLADDATLGGALLDRLLHHPPIVQIARASYRTTCKQRIGHVRARAREGRRPAAARSTPRAMPCMARAQETPTG